MSAPLYPSNRHETFSEDLSTLSTLLSPIKVVPLPPLSPSLPGSSPDSGSSKLGS